MSKPKCKSCNKCMKFKEVQINPSQYGWICDKCNYILEWKIMNIEGGD